MKIMITGGTGLVGRELKNFLVSLGHEVDQLSRPADWNPDTGAIHLDRLEAKDAVVHLAGENIASGRWTAARKARIRNSRVDGTKLLVDALAALQRPPKVLVSASAAGYYGNRPGEVLDEQSQAGKGFLPEVCREWEGAASAAAKRGIRVAEMRFGIVLSADGGALPRMLTPFRLGMGGMLGDGRQFMSWITLRDLCRAIDHVIVTESLSGAVNAVSPTPVTNSEFTAALASALRRPALMRVPRFALRLLLGEMADELLLSSIRVVPAKLVKSGFQFEDDDIAIALGKNVGKVSILHKTQWIARRPEEVFPFFANANNLEQITPPWLKFKLLNPVVDVHRGTLIDYKLRLHGVPLSWRSEILEWEPPFRFVDVQRRGPYMLWIHEHRFEPHNGGTLVRDTVQYAAPGGPLVQKLLIDRDLDSIFRYRRDRLEEHFG